LPSAENSNETGKKMWRFDAGEMEAIAQHRGERTGTVKINSPNEEEGRVADKIAIP
jgi:hypothetical protein